MIFVQLVYYICKEFPHHIQHSDMVLNKPYIHIIKKIKWSTSIQNELWLRRLPVKAYWSIHTDWSVKINVA